MNNNLIKREIRLIAFDMDGTLLNDNGDISNYTINILDKVSDFGVKLIPITGRPLHMLLPLITRIKGIEYVASSNGAVITDVTNGIAVKRYPVSKELSVAIYDLATSIGQKTAFLINGYFVHEDIKTIPHVDKDYVSSKFEKDMDIMIKKHGLRESILACDYPIEKVTVHFDTVENKYKALEDFNKIKGVTISYAHTFNLEVNALGVTKGRALETIADIYNIPIENTMAFGDGVNDISMIENAGIGVVMGNALEELKDYGDYITFSNNDDGVAKAIERFLF